MYSSIKMVRDQAVRAYMVDDNDVAHIIVHWHVNHIY